MLKQFLIDGNVFELKILNLKFLTEMEEFSQLTLQLEVEEKIENLKDFVGYVNQSDQWKVTIDSVPAVTLKMDNPKVTISINERDSSLSDDQARPSGIDLIIKGAIDFE